MNTQKNSISCNASRRNSISRNLYDSIQGKNIPLDTRAKNVTLFQQYLLQKNMLQDNGEYKKQQRAKRMQKQTKRRANMSNVTKQPLRVQKLLLELNNADVSLASAIRPGLIEKKQKKKVLNSTLHRFHSDKSESGDYRHLPDELDVFSPYSPSTCSPSPGAWDTNTHDEEFQLQQILGREPNSSGEKDWEASALKDISAGKTSMEVIVNGNNQQKPKPIKKRQQNNKIRLSMPEIGRM